MFCLKAVSNLDEESRWTVHYTAPWHQQENVFLPATRPPCVEDLHRQAKLNLKSVLRECDKLRRDGYRSSQYYSQGPTFAASTNPLCDDYQNEDEETDQKCSISSSEEEGLISIRRPNTPTSSDFSDLHTQTNWTKSLPLPTPEEKMRQQAQTIQADVVPINITGENFDRQASLRRSLIYTDTLVRRPKKVKRRKTITGVPDNIQKELASGTGQDEVGAHSVYTPDRYSTLGRLDSSRAAGQRSEMRDSSCQTEEVKVVPPSMRRIRAQKGQGIAAQMSHFSGSSGNMSVLSDSAGIVFPSRLHSDAGFHSLPRSGARANIQSLEPRLGPLGPAEDLDGSRPYQSGNPQVDENLGHLGGASRTGTLLRPKSQELRHFENVISPACVVSPHATYSTSIIPNATLSSSPEVIIIHAAHSPGQLDGKITSSCSYLKAKSREHLLSRHASKEGHQSHGGHWTEGHPTVLSQALDPHPPSAAMLSSLCDSAVSLNTPASRENGSQAMTYDCKNNLGFPAHAQDVDGKSESSFSEGGGHGSSEPWEYGAAGNGRASPLKARAATPGFSTPGSNMSSCSLDQTSTKDDARSLYSEEHDGFYASMHPDPGHGSGNLCNSSDGFGNPRHSVVNVFDGRARKSQGDRPRDHDKSLSRNISLKKAKKPPLPPSRTDSLRRVPKKGVQANGQALNESLIASLQHSLQLNLPGKSCKEMLQQNRRERFSRSPGLQQKRVSFGCLLFVIQIKDQTADPTACPGVLTLSGMTGKQMGKPAGVPEPDTGAASSEACDFLREEGSEEVMTPSRPRTTEDLFAAIHRSKRKVLGRKDSDDDHSRNHSPSPPRTRGPGPGVLSRLKDFSPLGATVCRAGPEDLLFYILEKWCWLLNMKPPRSLSPIRIPRHLEKTRESRLVDSSLYPETSWGRNKRSCGLSSGSHLNFGLISALLFLKDVGYNHFFSPEGGSIFVRRVTITRRQNTTPLEGQEKHATGFIGSALMCFQHMNLAPCTLWVCFPHKRGGPFRQGSGGLLSS
ncbi:Hypothetical predicted protein [Lynx pardinus]|uniref:NHS-like protein 1 n=1 Tax=Lynx pardinus TaxID=191816 RepID=A0A485MKY3_LYNPA|nr:Hypothetical predicted protein [Lynx pardinus]